MESELGLDISCFLLRYHKDLDYYDFSDDVQIIQKIRRAEMYRNWTDIEDLAGTTETIGNNF
jgi:hypothetical protein